MKKKIIILVGIIFLILFSISIENIESSPKEIAVSSTPVSSRVIVVDAGHGFPDVGAVGIEGTSEEHINLNIALKLQKLLENSGAVVLLTRSDENGIYSIDSQTIKEKKVSDIKNRVEIGNEDDVDIFISIHLNKFQEEKYKGWQSFYQERSEDSKLLAECIQNQLNNIIKIENNRVPLPLKNIYIMDKVEKPTITIECGFLSNEEELNNLKSDEYQDKLAWGIYTGIQEYFKEK